MALLLVLVVFAWLGMKVHARVDELSGLGRGVQDAGSAVTQGFDAADPVLQPASRLRQ